MLKFLVLLAVLQVSAPAPAPVSSHTAKSADSNRAHAASLPDTNPQATPDAKPDTNKASTVPPTTDSGPEALGATSSSSLPTPSSVYPQPHIAIADPPPGAPAWPIQDRISWGANLVLAFLGYAGILIALRILRRIEQQTRSGETLAQAALESANATRLQAQAILNAERPWILITVEPLPPLKNAFRIVATNRGRSPAEIIATADRIGIAVDENHLPASPEFTREKPLAVPAILVPGESTVIQPFGRDDVKWICKTEESLRRVELSHDTIFLYGRLVYRSLVAPGDSPSHQVDWCCKYIHGETASNLVIAGPPAYNKHVEIAPIP
jgi:hypothetical protein